MFIFLTVLHVMACVFLILVILLQAGRGGGLSEMFGGGGDQTQKMFGTQTNVFLVKLTSVMATMFILTSITLAVMSANRGKSLLRSQTGVSRPLIPKSSPLDDILGKEGNDIVDVEDAVSEIEKGAPPVDMKLLEP